MQIFLSVWSEQLKADTQILAPSLGHQAPWASDFGHLCASFFVCCEDGLYKEVFTSTVLYPAVSVQTSLALPVVNERFCCSAFGRASAFRVFSGGIIVCGPGVTTLLSEIFFIFRAVSEVAIAGFAGVMQLSPPLLCPHSLALSLD